MSAPAPRVSTTRVDNPDGSHIHVAWCPWCEELHYHGMTAGHRAPHCWDRTGSPFKATGYQLEVTNTASRAESAIPPAPLAKWHPLRARFRAYSDRPISLVGFIIIGAKRPSPMMTKQLAHANGRVVVLGKDWNVSKDDNWETPATGDNLLTEGVVALRLIESATGARLDAHAVLEVKRAIDAWIARGEPQNAGRRS